MNYAELGSYIKDLQESGFDTVKLHVQYYKKFAVPVFALIMALISVPFGFLVGNRGAMTGVGVSIAVAMAYLGIGTVVRSVRQCEPAAAGGGGLGAGRSVLAGGHVSDAADAQLKP